MKFLSRVEYLNQAQFFPPGYIWPCLESWLVVTTGVRGATSISWVDAKDPDDEQDRLLTTQNYPVEILNSAKIERPRFRIPETTVFKY